MQKLTSYQKVIDLYLFQINFQRDSEMKLCVAGANGKFHQWWINFREHYSPTHSDMDDGTWIDAALAEWHGYHIGYTDLICFDNESGASLFLLRWA
jgi:hypothetical protein